jgi:hypothetical protein
MSIQKLRKNARVEIVDDERSIGNGVIVTLKQGWSFDPVQDNRVSGEDTPHTMLEAVKAAYKFAGPYTS